MKQLPTLIKEANTDYMVGADITSSNKDGLEVFSFCVIKHTEETTTIVMSKTIINKDVMAGNPPSKEYIKQLSKFYNCQVLVESN